MSHRTDEIYRTAYDELRSLARHYLYGENAAHAIHPTELVNEAVVRLYGKLQIRDRQHLVRTVARAMRRVLVDAARGRARIRHGENAVRVTLHDETGHIQDHTVSILEIDAALSRLAVKNQRVADVAEMTIFGGLSQDEIAEHLGAGKRTIVKDWSLARAWLTRELELEPPGPKPNS